MNMLICSVGRRVQLIDHFRKEFHFVGGKVLAVDCDPTAPALYHADWFEIVPRIDHPDYLSTIITLCAKYKIDGILSLIDPELAILANHREELERNGVRLIQSNKPVIDICFDKFKTHQFLKEHQMPTIPTYVDYEKVYEGIKTGELTFPVIVKPKNGSASTGVKKLEHLGEMEEFLSCHEDYIVQPFMSGNEYCVECYIDLQTGDVTRFFSKRKFNMRAGETDKSVVVKDAHLEALTYSLIQSLKPSGPIDIDFFKTEEGYVISEINPRFGGGYPYAYAMGQNFIVDIIHNLRGESNPPYEKYSGKYEEGKTMVRYDQFIVL